MNFYFSSDEISIDSNLKIITLKNTGWTIQIDPTYCEKELREKISPEFVKELEQAKDKLEQRSFAYWIRIETHGALQLECDKCNKGFDKAIYHPKTREIYCDSCFELIKAEGILEANSRGNHEHQECVSEPTIEFFKNPDDKEDNNLHDEIKNGKHFTLHGKLDPDTAKRFKKTTEEIIEKHKNLGKHIISDIANNLTEESKHKGLRLHHTPTFRDSEHTELYTDVKPPSKKAKTTGIKYHQSKTKSMYDNEDYAKYGVEPKKKKRNKRKVKEVDIKTGKIKNVD